MATTNAESPCYVADTGLAVKTYMDIALSTTPYPVAERTVQEESCIPGDSNAGALQVNDFGTADSRRVLEFSVPYAEAATVAAINTNVVLRAEGSIDGENFFNLSESNADTTVTANGTNAFTYRGKINYIRLRFVSESGGTDATVDAAYTGR